jgi:hypothetical protein
MDIRWSAGIGDPSAMGWFTVFAYLATAGLCAVAATRVENRTRLGDRERRFWLAIAAVLLILGINKQLDLQSLLTAVGRVVAKAEGWYGQRRHYQFAFVGLIAIAAIVVMLLLHWRMRSSAPSLKLALFGLAISSIFVVVRAASFHHVDLWLNHNILGLRWSWVAELTGIAIIAAGAIWRNLKPDRLDSRA